MISHRLTEELVQKRQIGSEVNDNKHQLKRARLTRENLALFNKMAKKKEANKASASASLGFTATSSGTKTASTSSGFAIQAEKNGILDPLGSKPPTNLEDIQKRYARSRGTASPTESAHQDYVYIAGAADNEATMVVEVNPRLLKSYEGRGYRKTFNQQFTGFPKGVGFNNGLSAPQPDFVEGLDMREYDPFPVDQYVSGAVLCNDSRRSLTLPHLAGEWKGRGKDMEEAGLQSSYDGAALVYARNQALSYIGKPDPPGHAEVTTFTTDGTNLNFFAHYAAPSEDGTLKYHQYPYASVNLKKYQEFKEGRRGLRNEQDHAREKSYALRDQLKEHWKQRRGDLNPIAKGAPPPIPDGTFEETNVDEDKTGHEVVEQPCQPTPAASSQPRMATSSVSSSKPFPPTSDYAPGKGGQKRKASLPSASSPESSRRKNREKI
ncbi:hypothetical protein GP486_007327 [Trichoglossum hirsutum]|uniref:Uncharacterized protein n=1 Tax=Trichoglossum hirsutum TaxID=265104 RepID=A0A9P8L6X5_9PEZI|nr:hypothetical protein GP486_007327 [Trichoglossum hirsutum]